MNAMQSERVNGRWLLGSEAEARGQPVDDARGSGAKAMVWIAPAEESRFARHAGLAASALRRTLALEAVWIAAEGDEREDLAPALYRALQEGRIEERNTVALHVRDGDTALARLLQLDALAAAPELRDRPHWAGAQLLDVALHELAQRCSPDAFRRVQPGLALEAVRSVRRWVARFYRGSWACSIFERTMARQQYVQSLYNMHHYVRQTTQHLGRAVAHASDRNLRRHLIDHLNGEINHEVLIENDLRHLGVDPDYVMQHRAPSTATKTFMAIQETSIAFYQDPMILMACPLVAEGITANMPASFVPRLRELVASWGVENPERATTFLASHIRTDGGDDGHWQATAERLTGYLTSEAVQRRFLCTLRAAADCIERSFNGNIDDFPLFTQGAEPR